jgi:IMP dehydrogenase
MEFGLSFDDVLLLPRKGVLNSRKDANLETDLVPFWSIKIPIVSANMYCVTGPLMAIKMAELGGIGFLHRNNTPKQAVEDFLQVQDKGLSTIPSVGLDDYKRLRALLDNGAVTFCLDVAHADHKRVYKFIEKTRLNVVWIVGNIATPEAAKRFIDSGVAAIKVGIGPGAACTTRERTGFGVPQLSAISVVAKAIKDSGTDVKLIADGGIKNSGDIVKALAAGADTVMIGRLLAGAQEANTPGYYAGSASNHFNDYRAPEGVSNNVELTGPVEDTVKSLLWGVRSGLSYGGATNLKELRESALFIKISPNGLAESKARI